jgi:hypothetical protein
MSKGNTTEADFIAYTFNATAISWNAAAIFYVALHTADPGEAGDQTTSEATYTSYARVAVTRNGAGWSVAGNTASNAAEITFPECTGGTNTITHVSVGLAASGPSQVLYKGALTASLAVSNLITPRFPVGTLTVSED